MSTVLEIERAIEALSPAQFDELAAWFAEKREQAVDTAFEKAILAGRFDAMAERALRDAEAGKCRPLDEFLDLVKALLGIIPAEELATWLQTPNSGFGGRKP